MQLTSIQQNIETRVHEAWRSHQNVMAVLPTGAGKTVVFSKIAADESSPTVVIAHRQELVGQISLALSVRSIYHKIIGPKNVVKYVVRLQMTELGQCYYDSNAPVAVAGVDTLMSPSRRADLLPWTKTIKLWVMDEGHHILRKNKWGRVAMMFNNARGLAVTATPTRADGRGLGRDSEGLMDVLIVGPNGRNMINDGYLTDYRIFAPPNNLDLSTIKISSNTGDYVSQQLNTEVRRARIVGDIVEHYKRIAPGALGITFCVDVETATETASAYNEAGVPAEVVCAKTPDANRAEIIRRFKRREILQLVNVDLFGEGFDVPAVEVISFGRPTASYVVYSQQFGRGLRPLVGDVDGFYRLDRAQRLQSISNSPKSRAIIIDHVGNCQRHGLPDGDRHWTLARRETQSRNTGDDVIPVTICPKCTAAYERLHRTCPYCGYRLLSTGRSRPEQVDGDLFELDAATLTAMRGEITKVDMGGDEYRKYLVRAGCPAIGVSSNLRAHAAQQEAQSALKAVIAWWAGFQRARGRSDSESYKRFYWRFGVDVSTAQTLPRGDAVKLAERVSMYLGGV